MSEYLVARVSARSGRVSMTEERRQAMSGTASEPRVRQVLELDSRFRRLTGREAFGYLSHPTPGAQRWTFADGTVKASAKDAQDYMATLLWLAQNEPAKLPYPLDQELPPSQDKRGDEAWVTERLS